MSQLTDFQTAAFTVSKAVIGALPFTIGALASVDCIEGEESHSRDSELGGYDAADTLHVVISRIDFELIYTANIKTYEGTLCTVGTDTWRIERAMKDSNYISFDLVGEDETS